MMHAVSSILGTMVMSAILGINCLAQVLLSVSRISLPARERE